MTNKEAIEELKKVDTLDMPARLCEAHYMAIKALEQEPCEVSEYDKDHIWYKGGQYISLRRFLEAKAEAEQEPKTGHWIDREIYDADRWKCSECGRTEPYKENYCPNCGCRMFEPKDKDIIWYDKRNYSEIVVEPQESEDKE